MTRRFWKTRLGVELVFSTLFSLFTAFLIFGLLSFTELNILKQVFLTPKFIEENTQRVVNELQEYIDENHILSMDMPKVDVWVRRKGNVILMVYDGNKVLYDSTIVNFLDAKTDFVKNDDHYRKLYTIEFPDKTMQVEMICFFEYRFRTWVNYLKIAVSLIGFAGMMIVFIKRKTEYINQLMNEIGILEGGDLDYKITVKGKDEIAFLAKSIDEMRIAFIERQEKELAAINSGHKLITAMSHDLRTPLTILIGYLDILDRKKYKTLEQQEQYIAKSKEKAYQIKQLSDKIFEYFLTLDSNKDRLQKEYFNTQVIHELLEDYIFSLNEKSFLVYYLAEAETETIYVDMQYIHRVFDNLFSNLIKYADRQKPIIVQTKSDEKYISVFIENSINQNLDYVQSSNIGLETSKKIMEQHDGTFTAQRKETTFETFIKFKIEKK